MELLCTTSQHGQGTNNAKNQGVAAMKIPTESVGRSVGAEGGEAKGVCRTYVRMIANFISPWAKA